MTEDVNPGVKPETLPAAWQGSCWRMLAPRWAHAPLSGQGAAKHGGRFNEPGLPALYMSGDFTTAIAEYEQDIGIRPGTLCAYSISIQAVFDLTDTSVLQALGIEEASLRAPWKTQWLIEGRRPDTWDIAARLRALGAHGVRVPSVQSQGWNLVLWRWNEPDAATVTAYDPLGDLPRDQRSWPG